MASKAALPLKENPTDRSRPGSSSISAGQVINGHVVLPERVVLPRLADHANSIILDQVENGVAIRMAVLYLLAARIPRQSV